MRNKKAVLTTGGKRICLAAGIVLVLASIIGMVLSFLIKTESSKVTLYSYQVKADASYRVHLRPNTLYEGEWLEEGGVYAEALTDYIELSFRASFQGSEPANVSGTYRIAAVTEGYQSGAESQQAVVYRKEFPLKEGVFPAADKVSTKVEELLAIQPDIYREYARQAEQVLQTSVSKRFYLTFTGILEIKTAYGEKKQDFAYQLTLPIGTGTSLYQITKPKPILEEDEIVELQESAGSVNFYQVVIAALVGIAGLSLLAFLFFFTRPPDREELWQILLKEILRKYGSRMSRLEEFPDFKEAKCVRLADIESLITLAEEIRRPVLYRPDEAQLPQDGIFYCSGEGEIYLFQLSKESKALVVENSDERIS